MGALVSHPLCLVGSWGACTPPATAAQAHLFSPVASALWPLPTTPPFLLLFPYIFLFFSGFSEALHSQTPRPDAQPLAASRGTTSVTGGGPSPPTPKRATAEAKETLAGAYRFY